MERDPSRRRFLAGCCVAGAGAIAAGGLAGEASAEGVEQGDTPATRWERTYEAGASATAESVAPAGDGGFVAVGTVEYADGETVSDIWLYKVDAGGTLVWERTFSERAVTAGFDVEPADDGFVVAGHTREEDGDAQSALALRVDGEGKEQWRNAFDAYLGTTDTVRAVAVDATGRSLFAGWTSRFDDAWAARLTDEGEVDWKDRYGPGQHNRFHGVVAASDGGYILVGESDDTDGDTTGWAVKLVDDGTQQFSHRYKKRSDSGTNKYDDFNVFYDVSETRNGFVAVGANAFDPKANDRRGWALEFNINGGKIWDERYGADSYTALHSVTEGYLEYFVVGETATDADGTDARGYAANLGIEGQTRWTGTWGEGSSSFSAFHLTDAEGMVCVGDTAESAGADTTGWGVKIGGEDVATATPSPTPTATRSPTPSPTVSPTPTDGTGGTDAGGETSGGGSATAAPTPTDAPSGGDATATSGDGSDAGTTAAPDGGGGLSTTTLGIGVVILALGSGGYLYNSYFAGDDGGASDGRGGGGSANDGGGGDDTGPSEPDTAGAEDVQQAQTVVGDDGAAGDADESDAGDPSTVPESADASGEADDGGPGGSDGQGEADGGDQRTE
ncbi:MAG: hypothetical protein ABEJ26_09290 [Halosimplex sp.]